MSPIRASIVIRCFNEERHVGRLLDGILAQTERDVEIILVDSGSTDRTLAVAQRYPVRIVQIQPGEFSFGRSLNRGCAEARGEYIVIASAHVYPRYRDWLERLLDPFSDPRVALVYGKQRGTEESKFSERQVFKTWFPEQSNPDQTHSFCNNANAAIRRGLWERFPYDEALTGLEDLAWAKQAREAGFTIAYEAAAEVAHIHIEGWNRIRDRYRREAIALKQTYAAEHFNLFDFARLLASNLFSDAYHAWRDGVLRDQLLEICLFRYNQFLGTFQGFNQRGAVTSELKQRFYYPGGSGIRHQEEQAGTGTGTAIDYSRLRHDADDWRN